MIWVVLAVVAANGAVAVLCMAFDKGQEVTSVLDILLPRDGHPGDRRSLKGDS